MSEDNTNTIDVDNTEDSANKNAKVEKKFTAALTKLTAIVQGKDNLFFPKKVAADALGDLVAGLFKEENEALVRQVREDLRTLLKSYSEMNKAFKAKQEELDKLNKQKKEEFVKAAETLFSKIDNIGEVEKEYYNGLTVALTEKEDKK